MLVCGNLFNALTTWFLLRFTWMRNHTLGKRLLARYLYQPYNFFLNRNTNDLGKNILTEVSTVISGVMRPGLELLAKAVVALFIFALLITVDLLVAITITITISSTYLTIYLFLRRKLTIMGKGRVNAFAQALKNANEAMCGIKELKVLRREQCFLDRFSIYSEQMAKFKSKHLVMSNIPKYVLETVAFGNILLIVLYLIVIGRDTHAVLPLIALYTFAGYRLMPALQAIFSGITEVRFNLASLDILYDDMVARLDKNPEMIIDENPVKLLPYQDSLEIRDVTYFYPEMKKPSIRNLNLTIHAHTTVGFVGTTGSGKTTTIDLVLGLLQPIKGQILIDGVPINDNNLLQWQKNLGYVPQQIFLSDDTVIRNIAFGVPDAEIDLQAVESAAKIANLHDFVISELPLGYETVIGERGIRLSGGQRQRIGIARALYSDPPVLILDEATSALDGITESVIMESVKKLSRKKTIIIVAHRLSTVKDCDVIFVMDRGGLMAHAAYDELMDSCPKFSSMARRVSNK